LRVIADSIEWQEGGAASVLAMVAAIAIYVLAVLAVSLKQERR